MAQATIRVTGLREVRTALRQVDRGLNKVLSTDLKKAAEPVVDETRSRLAGYAGIKLSSIRPRVAGRGNVYVRQHARKVTGRRGDFGALQMRHGFIPAAHAKRDEVRENLEEAIDRLTNRHF